MRPALAAHRGGSATAFDWLWLLAWALASAAWCLTASAELSATFDEPLFVTRGLEAWRSGSHGSLLRLGVMPLSAEVQTLPLFIAESWHGTPFDAAADLDTLLPWARAATLGFWWLLLIYAWRAARDLAGAWGGRLAVALLACEPSLLAHAGLATTDIPVAACLLALAYHFRVGRDAAWPRRLVLPMAWGAAAILAKGSALVIAPVCLLVIESRRLWPHAEWGALRRSLRDVAWIVGGSLIVVFLYCGSDWQPEPSFVAWARDLPAGAAWRAPMGWLAEHLRIFSNAGDAIARQVRHNIRGHGAFLFGTAYPRAVWYYFPAVLTVKLSEPLLLAVPLVALFHRRALVNWALLVAAALVVYSLTFRVQIGIRLVLPIVVFATVGSAAALAAAMAASPRWPARLLAGLTAAGLAWNLGGALTLWPDGLVFVNRFWGGTAGGYRLVSDSNYDWGQGVKALRDWQRRHGQPSLAVWYFGTDPLAQQPPLRLVALHTLPIAAPADVAAAVGGDLLAVSTTLLYGSGLDSEGYRQSLAALRERHPVARAGTFFIYDLNRD